MSGAGFGSALERGERAAAVVDAGGSRGRAGAVFARRWSCAFFVAEAWYRDTRKLTLCARARLRRFDPHGVFGLLRGPHLHSGAIFTRPTATSTTSELVFYAVLGTIRARGRCTCEVLHGVRTVSCQL